MLPVLPEGLTYSETLLTGTPIAIRVHDHGSVRYLDHMGDCTTVADDARISYGSKSKGPDDDKRLIRRLFKDKHTSPFEMVKIKFLIRMPIFVMRQYVRHRMQNLNEISARYSVLPDVFFIPKKFRLQDAKNKQSSNVPHTDKIKVTRNGEDVWISINEWNTRNTDIIDDCYTKCYETYLALIQNGVAREQARIVLPVGIYTEIRCCWDLKNLLFGYFPLRDHPHAQGEHQDYAKAMKTLTRIYFPLLMEIYDEFQPVLSASLDQLELKDET